MTIEWVVKKYLMYSIYLETQSSGSVEFQVSEKKELEEFLIFLKMITPI